MSRNLHPTAGDNTTWTLYMGDEIVATQDGNAQFNTGDYVCHRNTSEAVGYVKDVKRMDNGTFRYRVVWESGATESMNVWWQEQELEYA